MKFIIPSLLCLAAAATAAKVESDKVPAQHEIDAIVADENARIALVEVAESINDRFAENESEQDDVDAVHNLVGRNAVEDGLRLAKVVVKYGKPALTFFKCISYDIALPCAREIQYCMDKVDKAPWECPRALECIGTPAEKCK
ncbi:hypothetical protein DCS_06348 [Drechmeria coniospora]|uniref:Uncharacterized protein n=1 Tax=Drechmeria coniospora TaxID=98403 RepID=A0A151GBA5_DRECN|nr:hypothetical protein DCS_06348 [Drechmeria coniospora]KYK54390.1 hypothetical protein DCS_06348 [Drechmeria coniospora]ODA77325.1 hypothetical protein RJ55_06953 [Drechmeria coniospora]